MSSEKGSRVLVVDDELSNRKLLTTLLEHEGYEVVAASGGREALDLLAREEVDLVLLDLMMPELDGLAVLKELSESGRLPELPVVVTTALTDREVRLQALGRGAVDFVVKPFDRLELVCRVATLVELRHLRRQAMAQAREQATAKMATRIRQALEDLPLFLYCARASEGGFEPLWVIGDVVGLMGLSDETFGKEEWLRQVHPDSREEVRSTLHLSTGASAEPWKIQYRWNHPSLGERWMLTVGRVERQQGLSFGAHFDVTETKDLERQFLQAQKMEAIGRLAGGIAHDFNNLLAIIMSLTGFARASVHDPQVLEDLDEVLKASERAAGLTRQLLTFSRRHPVSRRPTDLNLRLSQLGRLLENSLGERVQLDLITGKEPAVVRIDPVQFDQLVLNLAVNARDAMPNGGRLRIELSPPGPSERVRLTVRDTGTGMDQETQLRIFEPFFTTKEVGRGTGLGLATCKTVVEEARGTITIESEVGRGTTFIVEFPASRELSASESPQRSSPLGHGYQVLLVEDEPSLLKALARLLRMAGYRAHTASNCGQAVSILESLGGQLDVLVTDVMLPDGSGQSLVRKAQVVAPGLKVLYTSGYLDQTFELDEIGEHRLLWKPVKPLDLIGALGEILGAGDNSRQPSVELSPRA